jgi:hypothetical protein
MSSSAISPPWNFFHFSALSTYSQNNKNMLRPGGHVIYGNIQPAPMCSLSSNFGANKSSPPRYYRRKIHFFTRGKMKAPKNRISECVVRVIDSPECMKKLRHEGYDQRTLSDFGKRIKCNLLKNLLSASIGVNT